MDQRKGVALGDVQQLRDLFASGAVESFARGRRPVELFTLRFSDMTATFAPQTAP
jgi:hypothetical protein